MIEVTILFGSRHGDGVDVYTVNIEPDAFTTRPYRTAIDRALQEFERDRPQAIVSEIKTRRVPPKPAVLEVE